MFEEALLEKEAASEVEKGKMSYKVAWHKEHGVESGQGSNPSPADADVSFWVFHVRF